MDIYQAIWDADMKGNGIRPITTTETKEVSEGYVVVDTDNCSPDHHIFKEVYIPDRKRSSFQLIETLFDNYTLNQVKKERNNLNESKEVEDFLVMAMNSLPGKLTKQFIEEKFNKEFTTPEWISYLHELWFRQFDWESGKDLSGFEHIFVGEQKKRQLVGHHFWYKYWLEDNAKENEHHRDQINMRCANRHLLEPASPYVITVSYHLQAYDYEKKHFIKTIRKKCAFLVGISAEGLLALGTVRAIAQDYAPAFFIINNNRFKLELYMSPDGKSIRTFYPIHVSS